LDFADDLVLITSGTDKLFERAQILLSRVEQEAKKVNLTINVGIEKSAYMLYHSELTGTLSLSTGDLVPLVSQYKYLGRFFYSRQKEKKDQKFPWAKRMSSAWGALHKLNIIWKSTRFSFRQKERFFELMVQSVMAFGSPSWNEAGVAEWSEMDRIFTKMRCMALNIRRYVNGHNVSLREIYGDSLPFSKLVALRSVSLLGHMTRRPQLPWTQLACYTYSNPLGRGNTLCSRVESSFGLDFENMSSLAANRTKWCDATIAYREKLLLRPVFVPYNHATWKTKRRASILFEEYQYVEEGVETFPFWDGYIHAYTDGSAEQDAGCSYAGYGVVFRMRLWTLPVTFPRQKFSVLFNATNNRAEIQAVIDAVVQAKGFRLVIHTDSALVWNFMHWGREAYRRYRYQGSNSDLWLRLDEVCRLHGSQILCIKVRAHVGNRWNELADTLANWGRDLAKAMVFAQ
jgi:ribonuclease HI